jgi:PAS domain S-box-containing protein
MWNSRKQALSTVRGTTAHYAHSAILLHTQKLTGARLIKGKYSFPENRMQDHPSKSASSLKIEDGLLQRLLDFLPDAILVVNERGDVVVWNRAIEELTGIPKKDILGTANYNQALTYHGQTKPLLIDVALKPERAAPAEEFSKHAGDAKLRTEAFIPELFEGRGGYILATASPVRDSGGNLIGAIESIRDISDFKRLESAALATQRSLKDSNRRLEEINTAFRILLERTEVDRKELQDTILANLKECILPHIQKLRKTALDTYQQDCLTAIETGIGDILSPFVKGISREHNDLTPMEIQIANLIREGRSTKEIAEFFHIADKTVSTHRYNLRNKLGLKNRKTNLRTYLLSLT